jgi:transposase-like protein
VTLLARLTHAFVRLTGPAVTPTCPGCGAPTVLRHEEAVGNLPVVLEQLYVCSRCGRHVTRVQPWAIPD